MRTGLPLSIGDLDDRREVLVVALGAHVPGIDPVLGQRGGRLGVVGQQLVPVVVEVADDRHVDAEAADLADHLGDRGRRLVGVDRHPHQLRAGVRQARDLDRGRVGIGGVGVGHRLDDDRVGRSDEHAADIDADGRRDASAAGASGSSWRRYEPRLRMMSKPVTQMMNANRKTKPTT